jgi:hypothetical protein
VSQRDVWLRPASARLASAEILALVERGYLRSVDIAVILGLTPQRVSQITRRPDFPTPREDDGQPALATTRLREVAGGETSGMGTRHGHPGV